MARRKKQQSILKKLLIVGGALAVVQIGLIFYFQGEAPARNMREEIERQVKSISGLTPERRDAMKVQLSLDDFLAKQGHLPTSLNELVPDYFEAPPRDPSTGSPFAYSVTGNKYTLGESRGGAKTIVAGLVTGGKPTESEQKALIASLDRPEGEDAYVYDPSGKRDPFRPFDLSVKPSQDCEKYPLTCFDVGQLRLSTVLLGSDEPKAMVDDATGHGHIVVKGTKIGRNNGEVVEILNDRVKIVETLVDVTGQSTTKVVELQIRGKTGEGAKQKSGAPIIRQNSR